MFPHNRSVRLAEIHRDRTNPVALPFTRKVFFHFVCATNLLLLETTANYADEFPAPGEWPCFRGNSALDGHAKGKGEISKPTIAWRHLVGSTLTRIALYPEAGATRQQIHIPLREPAPENGVDLSRWFPTGPTGDIAGLRQPILPTATVTYADVLPDVPGLEKIEFASAFATPTVNGQWQYSPGRLLAWRGGSWEQVWETAPLDHSFQPSPLAGDFDGDGHMEVAVVPFKAMCVYDATTGELKQRCEFTEGRSYGFFGVYDFDHDGKSEFLVMGDFAKHIDVLGYRDGKLSLLWQKKIEMDIARPQKMMRVLPEPVTVLDKNGRSEILVNLYNNDGEACWTVVAYDALTGDETAKLAHEIVQGFADLDGDGTPEILTLATNGPHVPVFGTIRGYRFRDGVFQKIWEEDNSAWQCHEIQPSLNQQNWAKSARVGALVKHVDVREVVVIRHQAQGRDEVEVSTRRWDGQGLKKEISISAKDAEAVALDANGAMLIDMYTPPGKEQQVDVHNARPEVLESTSSNLRPCSPPVVVRIAGRPQPVVLTMDSSSTEWVVIEPPTKNSAAKELWRISKGFAVDNDATASGNQSSTFVMSEIQDTSFGPTVAQLTDDGNRCLVLAGATPDGTACLAAVDLTTGKSLWHQKFDRFSAGQRFWNSGGPLLWQSGKFSERGRQDVLITLARSNMHSEETFLLNGRTGDATWNRDSQIADRGFGGQPFAIADFNGNGLDDLASFHPDIHYIADGATGKDLLAEKNYWDNVPLKPVYWGQPVAGRFDPNSQKESLLFTTNRQQMIGRVNADGSLAWSDAYDKAANGFPAIGDFDGDGAIDAMFIGFDDGIRCYDTATGRREWTLDLARHQDVGSAVSGDIDGDGKDEAIFVLDKAMYCVGTDKSGHSGLLKWELKLPTSASSPILADVTSTSKVERHQSRLSVLVTGADGYIYCIDSTANSLPGKADNAQR